MYNNILTYLCFFVLCGLVVVDMWLSTNILLQMVCCVLALLVVCLTVYVAHKWHKGTYLSNEQQSNFQGVISDNIALTKELDYYKTKQVTTKQNSTELQQLILFNTRLTAQISNLKTHLLTVTEQLQTAKNSKQTAVVPITPNEQKQTASNNKKAKTA